jgi:NADP-dependent 3-hydroxy acid dehydrogenase YdfG
MAGVIVTGAASGIGRACAETLAAEGRRVALWDIATDVVAVADSLGMPYAVVDVCDAAAMATAVDAAVAAPLVAGTAVDGTAVDGTDRRTRADAAGETRTG